MGFVPKALADRPVLDYRQAWYFDAFNEISASRSYSMAGPLPISIDSIRDYCEFYGISEIEQRTQLARFVRILDGAYLDDALNKSEGDKPPSE